MTASQTAPQTTRPAVRTAGAHDVRPVAGMLAASFLDDPVFGWCVPDHRRRESLLPAFFELVTSMLLHHREVRVTGDGHGAALWVPPGRRGVPEDDAGFESRLAGLLGPDAERTFAVVQLLDEHHPTRVHRYLWFLGVAPQRQGQGLGSLLLRSMLSHCDQDGVPAYLEATSERNRRLYARHGFEVVAELSVGGCPPLWAMWREPGDQVRQRTGGSGR